MQYVATIRINGSIRQIISKNMQEWMARTRIQSLIQELSKAGKQVKLISFKPLPASN
jgi:hypothetical protein